MASVMSVGFIAGYFPLSEDIPLEVKEPIEILNCPMAFSLFPGETAEFDIEIQNLASINYSIELDFSLNNTAYQEDYVTFSDETYVIKQGKQTFTAWLKVSPKAPTGNFLVTIRVARRYEEVAPTPKPSIEPSPSPLPESPHPSPTPTPESPAIVALTPLLELLGSGASWAASDGNSVLVINWKDTYDAHHATDGAEWGPWPDEGKMNNWSQSILLTLEQKCFNVATAGDIPEVLSNYDLVVIHSYWAVEPKYEALLSNYVIEGGGLVILAGVPCYLNIECKHWWPGSSSLPEWLGGGFYMNAGGNVTVAFDNPFGTGLLAGDTILQTQSSSCAAVASPTNNGQIVAQWCSVYSFALTDEANQGYNGEFLQGYAFAFTHEFGQGRVYYQALF